MQEWLEYCLLGTFAGVLAGVLGIGGGVIVVPVLGMLFARLGFLPDVVQHLAVGTSLACIVFTSLSSMRAHHGHGGVNWPTVRQLSLVIVAGTLSGAWLAARMSTLTLRWVFVVFLFFVAFQMLVKVRELGGQAQGGRSGIAVAAGLIGCLSSRGGIGGGSMLVPLLLWNGAPMRTAIGTSAALGFLIALSGTVGSVVNGVSMATLPDYSLGFVYLPALAGIAVFSMMTAPMGAWLAQRLPVPLLRRSFAVLLIVMAVKLLADLL
jgi:uncharacterized membrane protein YfcA